MSIITCKEVFELSGSPELIILDASMPPVGIDLPAVKMPCYIPGARRFDINEFSDSKSGLPHMMLAPAEFQQKARELGINHDSKVVVYDNVGIYSSPRVWWNFKIMGLQNVVVMGGGLPAWISQGFDTVSAISSEFTPGNFSVKFQFSMVIESAGIIDAMEKQSITLVDVRSEERFNGVVEEPRVGLRRGHIPGSYNIPFTDFYSDSGFKSCEKLELIFKKIACKKEDQLVFSCGSGVTACIAILAAAISGYSHLTLYDGSWLDWASNKVLPTE